MARHFSNPFSKPTEAVHDKDADVSSASASERGITSHGVDPPHGGVDEKPANRVEAVLQEAQRETTAGDGEDEIEYPKAWRLAVVTLALCLSVFCMALDNTIIATAIPKISMLDGSHDMP